MKTPILFIIFNRPKNTAEVFSAIKKTRPRKLFIAADGPRKTVSGEEKLCRDVRNIVANINWQCEVKRLYSKKNMGCKRAVTKAIDWFFINVDQGIILEDDCLPNKSFFRYCEEMLEKYKNNNNVMHISGNNFQNANDQNRSVYYFSKYGHIWGWATWRRAWKKYDADITDWPEVKENGIIENIFNSYYEKIYWYTIFDKVYKNKIDTWDYQWLYAIWVNNATAVNPCINLVKNIGFSKNSTHLFFRKINTNNDIELKFPINKVNDHSREIAFDNYESKNHFFINIANIIYQKYGKQ